jgi:two-component system sensor histidine kinase SenX3
MESAWLVPAALAVGVVIGAALVLTIAAAERNGRRAAALASPILPAGIDQVIEVLDRATVLIDPSSSVVRMSPSAPNSGLFVNGGLRSEIVDVAREVRATGELVERDVVLTRGGRRDPARHFRVRAALIGSRWVLIMAEDRTESIRLEEVRRDFVANVSHELKTPIGAVGLLAEAIELASDDPDQVRRFTSRLTTEAQRLAHLTQEIIDLSRIQGADPVTQIDTVSVDAIVSAAVDRVRVPAEAKSIEVIVGGTKKLVVTGSETMLVTAVLNLVSNAVQYSPERSRVGIGVIRRGGMAEIAVTDQGVGIAEDEQERVFERFFRIDPARSRNTGGTGLGLAIVKHVVYNHGGEVRLWSQPGRGSTFTILLPLADPASGPQTEGIAV